MAADLGRAFPCWLTYLADISALTIMTPAILFRVCATHHTRDQRATHSLPLLGKGWALMGPTCFAAWCIYMPVQSYRVYVLFHPKLRERLAPYIKPRTVKFYLVGLCLVTLLALALVSVWGPAGGLWMCQSR